MKTSYALNNFNKAIRVLANNHYEKRKWLCSKYVEHLCQLELTDIPCELRDQFVKFKQDMKLVQANCNTKTPKMTVDAMDDAQVDELIAQIIAMREVCQRVEQQKH